MYYLLIPGAASVAIQVVVFRVLYKAKRNPNLFGYIGYIALPLAITGAALLTPFIAGVDMSQPIWEIFQVIIGLIIVSLVMQSFGFSVILKRRATNDLRPRNVIGLLVLVTTPFMMIIGGIIVAFTSLILPVLFFLVLYIIGGISLLLRKNEPDGSNNAIPKGAEKDD